MVSEHGHQPQQNKRTNTNKREMTMLPLRHLFITFARWTLRLRRSQKTELLEDVPIILMNAWSPFGDSVCHQEAKNSRCVTPEVAAWCTSSAWRLSVLGQLEIKSWFCPRGVCNQILFTMAPILRNSQSHPAPGEQPAEVLGSIASTSPAQRAYGVVTSVSRG